MDRILVWCPSQLEYAIRPVIILRVYALVGGTINLVLHLVRQVKKSTSRQIAREGTLNTVP